MLRDRLLHRSNLYAHKKWLKKSRWKNTERKNIEFLFDGHRWSLFVNIIKKFYCMISSILLQFRKLIASLFMYCTLLLWLWFIDFNICSKYQIEAIVCDCNCSETEMPSFVRAIPTIEMYTFFFEFNFALNMQKLYFVQQGKTFYGFCLIYLFLKSLPSFPSACLLPRPSCRNELHVGQNFLKLNAYVKLWKNVYDFPIVFDSGNLSIKLNPFPYELHVNTFCYFSG